MKFTTISTYLAIGVSAAIAAPAPESHVTVANLPGLNSIQSNYARSVIAKAREQGVGRHGCEAAIATCLVEVGYEAPFPTERCPIRKIAANVVETKSELSMYANRGVPASLRYHYDQIGSDHDSVGLYQQRASVYPNIACDMDAACSTGQFIAEMKRVSGWQSMSVGTLCQRVQRSAHPDRYATRVSAASQICAAGGL